MIAMEERIQLGVHSAPDAELRVERKDISIHDLNANAVRIRVTVRNAGGHRSLPTSIRLESAPLGAFVPWQPLATLSAPALEPGESRELTADVARPHPAPLGNFDRVPPKRLLTALNSPDRRLPRPSGLSALFKLLRRKQTAGENVAGKTASLAPDLWEFLGSEQPHWAGNINVFIGAQPVERHLARALRVHPGRTNLAMFVVGGPGMHDAYSFDIVGLPANWKAALYNMTDYGSLMASAADSPVQESQWVESTGGLMVMLDTRPPSGCRVGNIEIHVTRRSCGKSAVVEFDLDPMAQGSGCYFV